METGVILAWFVRLGARLSARRLQITSLLRCRITASAVLFEMLQWSVRSTFNSSESQG